MLNTCRLCLNSANDSNCVSLVGNDPNSVKIIKKLGVCVPKIDMELVEEPLVCRLCVGALNIAYDFQNRCLQSQNRIYDYFKNINNNELAPVMLDDLNQETFNDSETSESDIITEVVIESEMDYSALGSEYTIELNAPYLEQSCSYDINNEQTEYFTLSPLNFNQDTSEQNFNSQMETISLSDSNEESDESEQNENVQMKTIPMLNNIGFLVNVQLPECRVALTRCDDIYNKMCLNNKDSKTAVIDKETSDVCNSEINVDVRKFVCDTCGSKFNRKSSLSNHAKTHINNKFLSCNLCKQSFFNKLLLEQHLQIHHQKGYSCDLCEYTCQCSSGLESHYKIHNPDGKLFHCNVCNKKYAVLTALKVHRMKHCIEKPLKCQICNLRFDHESDLKHHKKMHNDARSFQCETCGYKTFRRAYLTSHLKVHSSTKDFACGVCKIYKSNRKADLKKHILKHHKN